MQLHENLAPFLDEVYHFLKACMCAVFVSLLQSWKIKKCQLVLASTSTYGESVHIGHLFLPEPWDPLCKR
jgi:hypothetical protein